MIVIDLEFTGLDPETHSIISLAAIDFEHPTNTLYLECKPRPGSEWDEQAATAHGFTKEYLSKLHLSEKQLLQEFFAWAEKIPNRTLAGQSMAWDMIFLWKGALRYDLKWPFMNKMIELHTLAWLRHYENNQEIPLKNNVNKLGLDDICLYVGLDKRVGAHNALDDAKRTAECFSRLLNNKILLKEFEIFPIAKWKNPINRHFSKDK